jgi:hypothetical protein
MTFGGNSPYMVDSASPDPSKPHDTCEEDLREARGKAAEFAAAATYFWYWNIKTPLRNAFHLGSLRVLQFFTLLLILEVINEIRQQEVLGWIVAAAHKYKTIGLVMFLVAAVLLFWHHHHETKKPEYEYKFVRRLYELIECSRLRGTPATIAEVLQILHSVFVRTGIEHVSIHLANESGVLRIPSDHVFPAGPPAHFFVECQKGEGIAGKVYADKKPRYMPRLFFPNWTVRGCIPFRHCVVLAIRDPKQGRFRQMRNKIAAKFGKTPKPLESDLVPDGFDLQVFKDNRKGQRALFRSLLSVPLLSMIDGKCTGVLSFDFDGTDPLDKAAISMAMILGAVAADVIVNKTVTKDALVQKL